MNNIRRVKKIGDYLSSVLVLIILLIIAFFIARGSVNMYKKSKETQSFYETMKQEYAKLENQYQSASNDLSYINTLTGFEKEVRERFDLSKEGEKAIFIIEEEVFIPPPPENKTFWEKTKDWLSF